MKYLFIAALVLFIVVWIVLTIAFSSWYRAQFESPVLGTIGLMLSTYFFLELLEVLSRCMKRFLDGR